MRCGCWHGDYGVCERESGHSGNHWHTPGGAKDRIEWTGNNGTRSSPAARLAEMEVLAEACKGADDEALEAARFDERVACAVLVLREGEKILHALNGAVISHELAVRISTDIAKAILARGAK